MTVSESLSTWIPQLLAPGCRSSRQPAQAFALLLSVFLVACASESDASGGASVISHPVADSLESSRTDIPVMMVAMEQRAENEEPVAHGTSVVREHWQRDVFILIAGSAEQPYPSALPINNGNFAVACREDGHRFNELTGASTETTVLLDRSGSRG